MIKNLSRLALIGICVAISLAFVAQQVYAAPEKVVVTVRLINARSGKPLRHIGVAASLWRQKPPTAAGSTSESSAAVTNRNGEVQLAAQPLCQSSVQTITLSLSTLWSPTKRGEPLGGANMQVSSGGAVTPDSTSFKLKADPEGRIALPASLICKSGEAQVKLRFAEEPSGKPLRRVYVYARAGAPSAQHERNPAQPDELIPPVGSILPETDARGIVTFDLPEQPRYSYVSFGPFSPASTWGCSAYIFPLDEILRTGIVAAYDTKHCGELKAKVITPVPGEVVIYDRVFSRWDWFLQELP